MFIESNMEVMFESRENGSTRSI